MNQVTRMQFDRILDRVRSHVSFGKAAPTRAGLLNTGELVVIDGRGGLMVYPANDTALIKRVLAGQGAQAPAEAAKAYPPATPLPRIDPDAVLIHEAVRKSAQHIADLSGATRSRPSGAR